MVRNTTEAVSPGREGQGMSRPSKENIRYLCRRFSTPLYKAPEAKRQAMEPASYFCRSLASNLEDWKKCRKARFNSYYIQTPSI